MFKKPSGCELCEMLTCRIRLSPDYVSLAGGFQSCQFPLHPIVGSY